MKHRTHRNHPWRGWLVIALSACAGSMPGCNPFNPSNIACGPDDQCPPGLVCNAVDQVCRSEPADVADAAIDDSNVASDGSSGDAAMCPTFELADICDHSPGSPIVVSNDDTIDTDTDPRCSTFIQPGGPDACLVFSTEVEIQSGGSLTATGSRPLILASSGSLVIHGQLSVSSRRGTPPGAGADFAGCSPSATPEDDSGGAGGGAGGSYQGAGGDGGRGDTDNSLGGDGTASPGQAGAAVVPPPFVRGGCAGQDGGDGSAVFNGGAGGSSGGAVLLLANAITIGGSVRANGAGAAGGESQSGGGGGGSGGHVAIEAAAIEHGGAICANGGGGGEGGVRVGGNDITGNPGSDGDCGAAATGGSGTFGSPGGGGNGSVDGNLVGGNGENSIVGAGGGGGGAGTILLRGPVTGSGTTSPPGLL